MKTLTALVAAFGLVAFSGAAFAMCSGEDHMPAKDQTAETPIPVLPEALGS